MVGYLNMVDGEARMTDQEIFDTVVDHLRQQACVSKGVHPIGSICMYHSPDGLKCAAGVFIPEDQYDVEMEGAGWNELVWRWPALSKGHSGNLLISRFQRIHDDVMIDCWESEFACTADEFDLVYTPPN